MSLPRLYMTVVPWTYERVVHPGFRFIPRSDTGLFCLHPEICMEIRLKRANKVDDLKDDLLPSRFSVWLGTISFLVGCLFVCLSVFLSVHLYVLLAVFPSVCLPALLPFYLSACHCVYLYFDRVSAGNKVLSVEFVTFKISLFIFFFRYFSSLKAAQNSRKVLNPLLNNAAASYEGLLLKFTRPGKYAYTCTRNNNFTNRGQKGTLIVN